MGENVSWKLSNKFLQEFRNFRVTGNRRFVGNNPYRIVLLELLLFCLCRMAHVQERMVPRFFPSKEFFNLIKKKENHRFAHAKPKKKNSYTKEKTLKEC